MSKKSKYDRILSLYSALSAGSVINKSKTAMEFGVNERTIQRDIDDIRAFLEDNTFGIDFGKQIVYDRTRNGYRMQEPGELGLTNSEILAVCKILLESRTLAKDEMMPIIDKLMQKCVPLVNKRTVGDLINNEKFHYIEPRHGMKFVDRLWDLGMAIREQRVIEISYVRQDKQTRSRRIKPVGIMVSEYYFYLAGYIEDIDKAEHFKNPDDAYPTVYRLDRIRELNVTDERFRVPYSEKFDEGEFRKRVQFMYPGRLQKIRFRYKGPAVEAVLDRLPTAVIVSEQDGVYRMEAEVFGEGWRMWVRGQGDWVEMES